MKNLQCVKIGDLLRYDFHCKQYPHFRGEVGMVMHFSPKGSDGKAHVRINWLKPVQGPARPYPTPWSDFGLERFTMFQELE